MMREYSKKLLSLVLAVMMMMSLCTPALAVNQPGTAEPAEITLGNATVTAGESFVVPVSIAKNPGITNFDFELVYDKTKFTLTKFSPFPSAEDEINETNFGICFGGTFDGNPATGICGWAKLPLSKANKALFFLYFTVPSTVSAGTYQIDIGLKTWNGLGKFQDGTDSPTLVIDQKVHFNPGTITVNAAPVTTSTVNFIDGVDKQTLTTNTNTKLATLPTEPVKAGHIFAGWYSGTVTGADAATYIVSGNSFTGTEFRPKYDAVTASADYHALWIPQASTAAYVKVGNVARIWETYAAVQTAINSATAATTVKMLTDCTQKLTIPAGKTITLDMNGHSITPNFTEHVSFEMNGIKNNGTLSLENSSSATALIAPTAGTKPDDWFINYSDGIYVAAAGVITSMRDITITTAKFDITGAEGGKVNLIDNCTLTTGTAEACISGMVVGELRNSTLTGTKSATITTSGMSITLGEGNTFKPAAGSPVITVAGSNTVVFPAGKTMGAADVNENYTLAAGFTVYYFNEAKTAVLGVAYCPTGTAPTAPATPTKPGLGMTSHHFDGWADSTGTLQNIANLTANTELYPKFTEVTPTDVASVAGVTYPTIQAAADAIVAGSKTGTITVQKDFTFVAPKYTASKPTANDNILNVPKDADITLDLGGHTITMEKVELYPGIKPVFVNQGKLLLKNGTITMPDRYTPHSAYGGVMLLNEAGGEVTLNGITSTGFEWGIKNISATIVDIVNTNMTVTNTGILCQVASGGLDDPKNPITNVKTDIRAPKILKITSGNFENPRTDSVNPGMQCSYTYIKEIAGGTFSGHWNGAILYDTHIDTISGGKFSSRLYSAFNANMADTIDLISGGTFEGFALTTFANAGNVAKPSTIGSITGGTFTYGTSVSGFKVTDAALGQAVGSWVPCGIDTISGGSFAGGIALRLKPEAYVNTISGGSFTGTTYGVKAEETKEGDPAAKGVTSITGGKFSGSTASVSPVGSSGACTVSGGSYKGDLVGVTYAANKSLGQSSDAQGYYAIVSNIVVGPPTVSGGGSATATVPDKALDAAQTTIIDVKTGNEAATETEVNLGVTTVGSMDQSDGLEIDTDDAAVIFDKAALADIKTNATASGTVDAVKLKVADKKVTDLLPAQQAAATGATKILDLKLTKGATTTDVTFAKGSVTIVVPYTKQDTTGTREVTVYYIANDGTQTRIDSTLAGGKLTFKTTHFSAYAIKEDLGQKDDYTMTVETAAQHYNPGDTIAANIKISTPVNSQFGNFSFTLGYDSTKLELVSITTALAGTSDNNLTNGRFNYTIVGATPNAVTSAGVVAATATFKVKATITTGTDTITLTAPGVTYQGVNESPAPVVVPKTVNLHNLKVSFAQGTGSTMAAATAYVKYDTAGLWTDSTYATPFTFPVPTATQGYRLATPKLWGNGTSTYTQAEVEALKCTADTALTVQTVQTFDVTFATSTGGIIAASTKQTVDTGTAFTLLAVPVPTANEGYTFSGWDDGSGIITTATYTITKTVTLTAKFAPNHYAWIAPSIVGATMTAPTGVEGAQVTYGVPATFQLTPDASCVVTAVSYTVGTGGVATQITANPQGVYTIPGDKILGDIKVEVTAQKYHTVAFQAGTGNTLQSVTAYVKDNTAGLFTDTTFGAAFTVPTPAAAATYRLAADTAAEPLWKTGSTGYTSTSINQAALTADTVLTAQAIKTYVVTFTAGANGALTVKPLTLTVDTGYILKAEDVPTPTPNSGYQFSAWTAANPVGQSITADTTYTANFVHGTYAISFSGGGSNVTFAEQTGIIGGNTATHGTAVTFKITTTNGYKVTAVKSTIGSTTKTLTANTDGVYTIPGDEIIDGVSVTAESTATYTVSFKAGANGVLATGDKNVVFDKDHVIAASEIPAPTPNSGYKFLEWQVNGVAQAPENHKVIAAITFTAVFADESYAITKPSAAVATVTYVSGHTGETATHGTDLVFTVAGASGKIVNKVSYQIGSGAVTPLTIGANGQFTIPGNVITAPVTISAVTLDGTITLVTKETYKAVATGKQMMVYTTGKLAGNLYQLSDGTELFYSEKYAAYVCFTADSETAATLATKLSTKAGTAREITYTGEIEGTNPGINGADAGVINDLLHDNARIDAVTDMQRFQADVDFSKAVTTADITKTLAAGVGK